MVLIKLLLNVLLRKHTEPEAFAVDGTKSKYAYIKGKKWNKQNKHAVQRAKLRGSSNWQAAVVEAIYIELCGLLFVICGYIIGDI